MTREDFEKAKELINEIEKLRKVLTKIEQDEIICLAPEQMILDGGFTKIVQADYKFSGELKLHITKTIRSYIQNMEYELEML